MLPCTSISHLLNGRSAHSVSPCNRRRRSTVGPNLFYLSLSKAVTVVIFPLKVSSVTSLVSVIGLHGLPREVCLMVMGCHTVVMRDLMFRRSRPMESHRDQDVHICAPLLSVSRKVDPHIFCSRLRFHELWDAERFAVNIVALDEPAHATIAGNIV